MKVRFRLAISLTLLAACAQSATSPDGSGGSGDAPDASADALVDAAGEDAPDAGMPVCGHADEACCDGTTCVPGFACAAGGHCTMTGDGMCGACGKPCCSGMCLGGLSCEQGQCATDGGCPDPNCGALGQVCCGGTDCYDGYVCFKYLCVPPDTVPHDAGTD